jgi:uncharacterized SAM-binding protein YcdF (DUF218 family)/lysophospholipase L1-like esterase
VAERLKHIFTAARRVSRYRQFLAGVLAGIGIVFAVQYAVNRTTLADRIVAPLLTSDTIASADAIVVLGAGVVGECGTNQSGVRRVLLAARLWREKLAPVILFTGGQAQGGCPIAVAMASLAQEVGVPEASILMESSSTTTHENGDRSADLLRRRGVRRVLVVTDRLHMRRAAGTFAQLGFEVRRASVPIYEGHPNNTSMLSAGAREFAALAYYRWKGWIDEKAAFGGTPSRMTKHTLPGDMEGSSGLSAKTWKYPNGPLVVLGASYAGGWQLEPIAGVPVVVRGVSGQQSFELLERFERDVVSAKPRAVIIWGFINDFFRTPAGDADTAASRVQDSFARMIQSARTHGIEPIVATEVTVRPSDSWSETFASWVGSLMGREGYQQRINRHVLATNQSLVDMARREGLLVLDLHSALAEADGRRRREFTADDGSHITAAGYAALTAYARPVLVRHLAVR